MKDQIEKVLAFHKAFGVPILDKPEITDRFLLRQDLINEEVIELQNAGLNKDKVETLDAIVDSIYILLGTAIEFGLHDKLEEAFNLVHENNMSKLVDGKPLINGEGIIVADKPLGKVLKPEGYKPVDLSVLF